VQRVLVVGLTGAGMTTMAKAVGARLGMPFHEMDALAWGGGTAPTPSSIHARPGGGWTS
jgi:adenylate kinase family enzyme